MLNGLDLFSGIGGLSLALEPWVRPIIYCERDRYAQHVLLSRMWDNSIPIAPIWDDVRTLQPFHIDGTIDIIFGGFPCQDISVAGLGKGLEGERSGLFFEIIRLVKEIKPTFVFLENVPAIRTRGLARVCYELASLGYDLRWTTISAASVGAPHLRNRWFLLAHSNSTNVRDTNKSKRKAKAIIRNNGSKKPMANSMREGLEGQRQEPFGIKSKHYNVGNNSRWAVEPSIRRVVNGLPNRVDRIKCLGNSVVPLQAREAFRRLCGLDV